MHFPKTYSPTPRAGSQVTGVGLKTPFSLEPLHGGQRDGRTETSTQKISGYETGLFSSILSSI
jgi:hypothetical protein